MPANRQDFGQEHVRTREPVNRSTLALGHCVLRDAGAVPHVLDPGPIIEERLKAIAAEYEPRLVELERAIGTGSPSVRSKRELHATRRDYARARRRVKKLGRSRIVR
jgi:hypothetical protein